MLAVGIGAVPEVVAVVVDAIAAFEARLSANGVIETIAIAAIDEGIAILIEAAGAAFDERFTLALAFPFALAFTFTFTFTFTFAFAFAFALAGFAFAFAAAVGTTGAAAFFFRWGRQQLARGQGPEREEQASNDQAGTEGERTHGGIMPEKATLASVLPARMPMLRPRSRLAEQDHPVTGIGATPGDTGDTDVTVQGPSPVIWMTAPPLDHTAWGMVGGFT